MSESPAWSAFGGPWGGSGPRLRDSGGGFAARARTAGDCSCFYDGPAVAADPVARRRRPIRPPSRPAPRGAAEVNERRPKSGTGPIPGTRRPSAGTSTAIAVLVLVGASGGAFGGRRRPDELRAGFDGSARGRRWRERTAETAAGGWRLGPGARLGAGGGPRLRDSTGWICGAREDGGAIGRLTD